jgi:hypothetical protein
MLRAVAAILKMTMRIPRRILFREKRELMPDTVKKTVRTRGLPI